MFGRNVKKVDRLIPSLVNMPARYCWDVCRYIELTRIVNDCGPLSAVPYLFHRADHHPVFRLNFGEVRKTVCRRARLLLAVGESRHEGEVKVEYEVL